LAWTINGVDGVCSVTRNGRFQTLSPAISKIQDLSGLTEGLRIGLAARLPSLLAGRVRTSHDELRQTLDDLKRDAACRAAVAAVLLLAAKAKIGAADWTA
jgi:hypothetical protein